MENQFDQLKRKYKTHRKAAKMLGITERHYVRIRNGEYKPSKSLQFLIDYLIFDESLRKAS